MTDATPGVRALDDIHDAQAKVVAGNEVADRFADGSRPHEAAVAETAAARAARDDAGARLLGWSFGRPRETLDAVHGVLESVRDYDAEVEAGRRFRDGSRTRILHDARADEANERVFAGLTALSGPVAALDASSRPADRLLVSHAEVSVALGRAPRPGSPPPSPVMVDAVTALIGTVRQPEYVGTRPTGRVLGGAVGAAHLLEGWGDPGRLRGLRLSLAMPSDPALAAKRRAALLLSHARSGRPDREDRSPSPER